MEKSEKSEVNVSLVCSKAKAKKIDLIDREPRSKGAADRLLATGFRSVERSNVLARERQAHATLAHRIAPRA